MGNIKNMMFITVQVDLEPSGKIHVVMELQGTTSEGKEILRFFTGFHDVN